MRHDDEEMPEHLDDEAGIETRKVIDAHGHDAAAPEGDGRSRSLPWRRIAVVVALVLVASSFAFAPVRTMAAGFLRVFRAQRVQSISLTQTDLERISEALAKGEGRVDMAAMGEAWLEGTAAEPKRVTLEQAQAAVDFPVRLPSGVDGTPTLTLQQGQTVRFKLKVDAVNEALRYYGSERTLPIAVDGKEFTVRIPAILMADYESGDGAVPGTGDPGDPSMGVGLVVGQARSPELTLPDGVDPLAIRDVLINLPFLPENVRAQLASIEDWQHTMLVPDLGGTSRDIEIDGVPAVIVTSPDGGEARAVVWSADGVVRGITGARDEQTIVGMARSMVR